MYSTIGGARGLLAALAVLTAVLFGGTAQAQVCTDCTACADGSPCDDGSACTEGETCTAGTCGGGAPANEGGACDDGAFCTTGETCTAGTCGGGAPTDCSAQDSQCTIGVCNEGTDACEAQPANEGNPCNDGAFCTTGETCAAGTCGGGIPADCSAAGGQCTVGVCNEATDTCEAQPANEGNPCNDGAFCTTGETCTAGSCAGGTPIDCSTFNGQCTVGVCNEATDACEPQPANEGNPCNDNAFCTTGEICTAGVCGGGDPTDCSAAGDQCTVGVCDETNDECVAQPANEGNPCDDGEFCSTGEVCTGGACGGGIPTDCSASGGACTVGVCDEAADACINQPLPDGGGCDDGLFCTIGDTCTAGVCNGVAPRDCSTLNGACASGVCDETLDACVAQPINEGLACDDGNACTQPDACTGGVCSGVPVVDCGEPRLVVANNGSGTATVLRTSDLGVEGTPVVGTQPYGVAIRPDAAVAYVTNNADDSVSVIDMATRTVLTTIPVGLAPRGVAFSPDGTRAYVANTLSDSITIIDAQSHGVLGTIELDPTATLPPQNPFDVAVSTTGAFLYVTNNAANTVSVFRTIDNALLTTIPVGVRPQGVTASPTGVFVYVACGGSNLVYVIRLPDHAAVAAIPVGTDPHSIAFTPDGRWALVTNSLSDTVSKINTDTFLVAATIPVPQVPQGIDVRGTGDRAYVAGSNLARVAAIDIARNIVVGNVPVGAAPLGLAVAPVSVFQLAAQATPTQVAPGGVVTYTLSYGNVGTRIASNVTLTASIPANTTFANATGGGVAGAGTVTWTLGTLRGGTSGQVSFAVTVSSPLPPGIRLTTTATIADDAATSAQASATATVNSTPQYSLAKVDDTDPVAAGGNLSYTITYANNAAANANGEGVVITETYPAGFTFLSSSPAPAAGTNNQWVIGSLPVGGSGTIIVNGTVQNPLPNGTILNNRVRLSDTFGNEVIAEQNTAVVSNPTLGIALAEDADPATSGQNLVFTISYTNSGNADATAAVVTAEYDPNVTFVSASPAPDPGTNNRWTVGAIPAGTGGQIVVTVAVGSPLPNGTLLTTTASIADGPAFATISENTVVSSAPALGVSILDAPDPVRPSDVITYTVTYGNTGTDVATAAALTLTYDATVTFLSATPPPTSGNNVWTLGDLAPGASGTISVDVMVNAPLGAIVTTNAALSAGGALSASSSANTSVNAAPVLSLGINDSPDPVQAGGTLTYAVQYGNTGNEPATGVGLSMVYSPNVTFVSATPPPDVGTTGQWTLGTLAAGASGQIQVTVQVNSPLTNGLVLTSQASLVGDGGLLANDSESTTVQSEAGLSIAKTDAVDPVGPSADLTYTITYSNPGTDSTSGVVVTEVYDPRVTFVSAVPPPDLGTTNTWTIGNLAGGGSGTIQVTVDVPLLPNGTLLTNRATVRDAFNRTATATQDTTVASGLFSLDIVDDPDPTAVLNSVTLTLQYGNVSGVSQPGVVLNATFDPTFVPTGATPAPDAGTNDTWTLGTLASGQTGQIVVTGRFNASAVGALARTDVQISNANGAAFSSETTTLGDASAIEQYSSLLLRNTRRDVWRFRAWIRPPDGFDPTGQPFSISIIGPGGVQHVNPLSIPMLQPLPSGRFKFLGPVPNNGDCRLKVVPRRRNWIAAVKCVGPGIVPPFNLAVPQFQGVISFGPNSFSTPMGAYRDLRAGARRYP